MPWAAAKVFDTRIRRNVKLAECPSFGKPIFAYAPKSSGAADYASLANEVLGEPAPVVVGPVKVRVDEVPALTATELRVSEAVSGVVSETVQVAAEAVPGVA